MKNILQENWWHSAIIYQIYPRSFYDSNQDGTGDLKGITTKLEYIASLGVDGIWICPFFKSPMKDFGYDVSDYFDVDPLFGTLADFDELISKAHQLNLKIMIDMVISHTSDQHPWFIESQKDRANPKADWYVWADAKKDGTLPNNWLSVFGGSAWQWHEGRQQYYLHNFLTCQPDLNFHHTQVVDTMMNVMRFWLERGVDGFRLDTVNFYMHDPALRDNPLRLENEAGAEGAPAENPYSRQYHIYDKSRPENLLIIKRIRALLNEFHGTAAVGELGDDNSIKTSSLYTQGDEHLHMVYTFRLLEAPFCAKYFKETIEEFEKAFAQTLPSYSFSNHDVVRAVSRWLKQIPSSLMLPEIMDKRFAKLILTLLFTLRGTIYLYQGEELALTEADIPFEKIQDPYGKQFYPKFKGRDGCRTPMPWNQEEKHAGFSTQEPWLPIPDEHYPKAVSFQEQQPDSILNFSRYFIHWRKQQPALLNGQILFLDAAEEILAFERIHPDQTIIVILNFSGQIKTFQLRDNQAYSFLGSLGWDICLQGNELKLEPFSAVVGIVERS